MEEGPAPEGGFAREVVERRHVQGDLHSHTTYSDGIDSLEDVADAALGMGYRYLAVTDHADTTHVNSLSEATLLTQRDDIDGLNRELAGRLTILQGVELDIGRDGSLPDLSGCVYDVDLVIVSIHSHFELGRKEMTERVVKALGHSFVNILGHPTARRLGSRAPVEMDLEVVFQAAAQSRVALEINSAPTRLDLNDDHIRLAKDFGCVFSIDTDSHAASNLPRIALGLEMAQKAELDRREVINCLTLENLKAFLQKR